MFGLLTLWEGSGCYGRWWGRGWERQGMMRVGGRGSLWEEGLSWRMSLVGKASWEGYKEMVGGGGLSVFAIAIDVNRVSELHTYIHEQYLPTQINHVWCIVARLIILSAVPCKLQLSFSLTGVQTALNWLIFKIYFVVVCLKNMWYM